MRFVPCWLMLTVGVFASRECLLTDYQFTNQDYTWDQFVGVFTNFPECLLDYGQRELVFRMSRIAGIHPAVILAKLQQESDVIINYRPGRDAWRLYRAMGYGMIMSWREPAMAPAGNVKLYKYGGFSIQVYAGSLRLRLLFDRAVPGTVDLASGERVMVINRATRALYAYTPFYGLHNTHGYESRGNELFEKYFTMFYNLFYK